MQNVKYTKIKRCLQRHEEEVEQEPVACGSGPRHTREAVKDCRQETGSFQTHKQSETETSSH